MSDHINGVSNRLWFAFRRRITHGFVADFRSGFGIVFIAGSRDVSDPRTDPGARVRGLEVGSLTSRLLSGAAHSRGEGRRPASLGNMRDSCPQSKPAEGEILVGCYCDRRRQADAIAANRRACLRGDGRPGPISPSTSPDSRWVVITLFRFHGLIFACAQSTAGRGSTRHQTCALVRCRQ